MASYEEQWAAAQREYLQASAAAVRVINEGEREGRLTQEVFAAAQAAVTAALLTLQRVLDESYAEGIKRRQRPPKPPNVGGS